MTTKSCGTFWLLGNESLSKRKNKNSHTDHLKKGNEEDSLELSTDSNPTEGGSNVIIMCVFDIIR